MLKAIEYANNDERSDILAEEADNGFRLKEDRIDRVVVDGEELAVTKFLVLTDEPTPPTSTPARNPLVEIDELKARVADLEARVVPR